MTLLDPQQLASLLGAAPPDESLKPAWGVAYDSRKVRPGDVFFALPGSARHGIEHADRALAAGAAYIVSDRPHARTLIVDDAHRALAALGRRARSLIAARVIAVTGSTGKTTVKSMTAAALAARATPGNLNTPPALVAALVEAAASDAGEKTSGVALTEGARGSPLVLELGIDRLGEMEELVDLTRPDDALLTTIAEAHLSAFGDVETVAAEKGKLLAAAPGLRFAGYAAAMQLPLDLRRSVTGVRVLTAPAAARDTCMADVTDFELLPPQRGEPHALRGLGVELPLPWPGRAMAENAALALAFAIRSGVEPGLAAARLTSTKLEKHRLQRTEHHFDGHRLVLIDDVYNSNPASAALALEALRLEPAPRVAFLGDMRELGRLSRQRHQELGEATVGLDLVVAVGEEAAAIVDGNPAAVSVPDLDAAATLFEQVPAGAAILFKASRSVGMERLVERFVEHLGGRA